MARMLYQGHGSYRFTLRNGRVIYVDPFAGEGYDRPADFILVTHEHPDHTMLDRVPKADDCLILRARDFQPIAGAYQTFSRRGVSMRAVPACNDNHPVEECVGVVLEFDGVKFYASGDTSTTDFMRNGLLAKMNLDYAALPGDGFYNMGPAEASECARLIGARHTIPVHLVPVHDVNDAVIFDRSTAEQFDVEGRIILEPGQELDL
ncbi:MAG: MBL fold metallo-hydrolase [Coriobacteriia bacterium]|nr:MBL fold metallo-hydrolase [Coriobacteriia bacterium]